MATPYGGFSGDKPAVTAPHLMVVGPTGVGKTRRVLAPGMLMWPGSCVGVSSKTDLMTLTAPHRARVGRCYMLDLTGLVHAPPAGVTPVVADPTATLTDDDAALNLALTLLSTGSLGAGSGASGASGSGDAEFWRVQADDCLAALLLAAGPVLDPATGELRPGDGMRWVMRAFRRPAGTSKDDNETPSWMLAVRRLQDRSEHVHALLALAESDDRFRTSVTATMKAGLAPWSRSSVRGHDGAVPWRPSLLDDGSSTLYIIAPATGVAAGAAVATVDGIVQHHRANEHLDQVHVAIDELANTAPLPDLPSYVTEARGLGVALTVAVHATVQLTLRWGADGAETLRKVFPAVLTQYGAPERELLEAAAWTAGETERWSHAYSEGDGLERRTRSAERTQALTASELLPHSVDEGRLLRGGKPGELVQLPDLSTLAF